MAQRKTNRLTTTALLIALATVLSFIKPFELPYGGSITLASMVPVIIIGYKYGNDWGMFSGGIYGILQAVLGATVSQAFAGLYDPANQMKSIGKIALMAFLDYFLAFMVLGLGGMFRDKMNSDTGAILLGGAGAVFLRWLCHFASGTILWGSYAKWYFTDVIGGDFGAKIIREYSGTSLAALYSFFYNSSYMLPEMIITVVVLAMLISIRPTRRYILDSRH